MLDLACGSGRHAIAAAARGAEVVAIDRSREELAQAQRWAAEVGVRVEWRCEDLDTLSIPPAAFDVVMGFRYLNRRRMADFVRAVRSGGYLIYETFHEGQTALGWGPGSADHLLRHGELISMVSPLEVLFAREVVESSDNRSAALASVLAWRPAV